MVYTNRTEKCMSSTQDTQKDKPSATPAKPSSSSGSSTSWSKQASEADKWKYNNMVQKNRDKFNGQHFC